MRRFLSVSSKKNEQLFEAKKKFFSLSVHLYKELYCDADKIFI